MKVEDVSVEAVSVDKNDHLSHAYDVMEKNRLSWILVTSSGDPVGVTGLRDLGRELGSVKKMDLPSSALHVATATREVEPVPAGETLEEAASAMLEHGVGALPVEGSGMVRDDELLGAVDSDRPASLLAREVPKLSPDDRLVHARELMLDGDRWSLPVLEAGRLVGVVGEAELAMAMKNFRDLVPGDRQDSRVRNMLVGDVMSTDFEGCRPDAPAREAADVLRGTGSPGVPVGEGPAMLYRESVLGLLG